MLTCCKLYISESRNARAIEAIEQAARLHPETVVINRFRDELYNRVGYTLVAESNPSANASSDACSLRKTVFRMVKAALETIDLELHSGTHPRVGVVDHICFHPLAEASLDQAAGMARSVAADIGHKLKVPIFLYGAAHPADRTLDEVRRKLGYFKPNSLDNQWVGGPRSEFLQLMPDEGPHQPVRSKGTVLVGATGWVVNYNVPLHSADIETVKRIARRVSGRGGGLSSVQAMGLAHGEETTEVACNLLDPNRVGADQVQSEVERLARDEGLTAGKGYCTDFSQEKIVELYLNSIKSVQNNGN